MYDFASYSVSLLLKIFATFSQLFFCLFMIFIFLFSIERRENSFSYMHFVVLASRDMMKIYVLLGLCARENGNVGASKY